MESNGKVPGENEKFGDDISRFPSAASPEQQRRDAKATTILESCKFKDIDALRTLATSEGGLVSDDVRRQACSCHPEWLENQY
jgi:hypothetical protein